MSDQKASKISVRDVAANRRRGGDIRVLLSPKTVAAGSGFMGVLTLQPGERINAHYHPYSEEFFYVVSGVVDLRIGHEVLHLAPGEAAMVPIGVPHHAANHGDVTAEAVFHLSPLAPRPELGHVDLEDAPDPAAPVAEVGGRP
jgi:putative monooxygenase